MILFNYKNSLRYWYNLSKTILIFLYNTVIPMEDKGLPFCKFLILNTILIKDILKLISISFKSKFILGIKNIYYLWLQLFISFLNVICYIINIKLLAFSFTNPNHVLDYYALKIINFMLNNLGSKSWKCFFVFLEISIKIFYLNYFISCCFSKAS